MKPLRRETKTVNIGSVAIGGHNPVAIQSMVKVPTKDKIKALAQIKSLEKAGCEIVRVAVKDKADAQAIRAIRKYIKIPLVADIHFDWKLAVAAIDNGADKIRLNPGNIYKPQQVREVARAAKLAHIPIRVGLNSGSLPKSKGKSKKLKGHADLMVNSALDYIKMLERHGFYDIVVSLKCSDIIDTLEAYRKMSKVCDYPLHLGVTATGLPQQGLIKSSIAIGSLLSEGIGDTIRISLTEAPVEEIKAARCILEALGLRAFGPQIISCPTCGRCEVGLVKIVKDLERKLSGVVSLSHPQPLKVAVMGCVVNGPGEAREADVGIAFGRRDGLLFVKGKPVKKVNQEACIDVLMQEITKNNA